MRKGHIFYPVGKKALPELSNGVYLIIIAIFLLAFLSPTMSMAKPDPDEPKDPDKTCPCDDSGGPCDDPCECEIDNNSSNKSGDKSCPCPDTEGNGGSSISYTEGTLRDNYRVVSLRGGKGGSVNLILTYASYNADLEKASINTSLGFGWTHTYNIFLFKQRGHMFRRDKRGRTTKFSRMPGTSPVEYKPKEGYFENMVRNPDGTFTITYKNGTTEKFKRFSNSPYFHKGPLYHLTERVDRNGNTTTLTYSNGRLTKITDHYSREITFTYNANNRIETITDPLGRVTSLEFDSLGAKLQKITDPDSKIIEYTYNAKYQITRKVDKNGKMFNYYYHNGKPVQIEDGSGNIIFYLNNPDNWDTDSAALAISHSREYIPSTTTKTDGRGNTWKYNYDKNGYITKTTAPDGAATTYAYDPVTLRLSSVTDANAHTTSYEYDLMGNRTKVTDHLGNETLYEYEPVYNKVTKITYPNSSITEYVYDADGNRTKETRDVGGLNLITEWTYDSNGNVLTKKDPNAHTNSYEYDVYGNLKKVTDPEGNITQYEYDIIGNRTKLIDANGHETLYEYDGLNRLIRETDPLGFTTEYSYDGNGNRTEIKKLATISPATYQITQYEYDLRKRLIREIKDPVGLNLITEYTYDKNDNKTSTIDPRGKTTTLEYDSQNRVDMVTDALGNTTQTFYDDVGNRTCEIDANSHYTYFEYDELNRLIREIKKIGTGECTTADGDDIVTQYEYDVGASVCPSCGGPTPGSSNISKIIDPNGKVTYFKYDKIDRRVKTIKKVGDTADLIDGDDWVETIDYDPAGNVLTQTDANGNATTFTYYDNNWLETRANALSETTTYTYDGVGYVLTTTDPGGNVTTNTYNERNELTQVTDSIGLTASYSYDGVGNRLTEANGNKNGTEYEFDAANRITSTIDAMCETSYYEYDDAGNVIRSTDREGNVVCYQYDDINRRTLVVQKIGDTDCGTIDSDDIQTSTSYDGVGNITQLTDANSNATLYEYDEVNRLIKETYADSGTREFTYDGAGNMLTRKDQKGKITTYIYNDLYYLTKRNYQIDPDDNFTYDTGGRMLTAERGGWTVTYTYDDSNRVTQTVQNGQTIAYAYDIPNRTRTITYPGGRVITEQMDLRQRLDEVKEGITIIADYTYDLGDRVTSRLYNNGISADYQYNPNDWVTELTHNNGGIQIAGFTYDFDKEGNKKHEEKQHDINKSEEYQYDDIYRLIDFKVGELVGFTIPVPITQTQYDLDKLGNWDSKTIDSVTENRTHNVVNEITAIDTVSVTHDNNGNLNDDGTYAYDYDEENRLISVTRKSDSQVVGQYQYDALSRRVVNLANPAGSLTETRYFYEESRVIEEQDDIGVTQATYVYGNYIDEVLTMDRGGQTYYFHQNSLWSVAAVTDSVANVVERYTYNAYGFVTITDGAGTPVPLNAWGNPHSDIGNPYMFTGRRLDEEAGLYYYRARYNDSVKGRFLQRDPKDYEDGMNLYEYVGGNPISDNDPTGSIRIIKDKCTPKGKRQNYCFTAIKTLPKGTSESAYKDISGGAKRLSKHTKNVGKIKGLPPGAKQLFDASADLIEAAPKMYKELVEKTTGYQLFIRIDFQECSEKKKFFCKWLDWQDKYEWVKVGVFHPQSGDEKDKGKKIRDAIKNFVTKK